MAVNSAVAGLQEVLQRAKQRAASGRLRDWRSQAAGDDRVAGGDRRAVGELQRLAGTRKATAVSPALTRSRVATGQRAFLMPALNKHARMEEARGDARSARTAGVLQGVLVRAGRRELRVAWKAWEGAVAQRRLQGAVFAATSSLEGERDALAAELLVLKQQAAARLLSSLLDRNGR